MNWWLRDFSNAYDLSGEVGSISDTNDTLSEVSYQKVPPEVNISYYLCGYGLIIGAYAAVSFLRMYAASIGSLNASEAMHSRLLVAILGARFQFCDKIAHGRLLNYFSQDIRTIDNEVLPMALGTLHFFVAMMVIVVLIAVLMPRFLIPGFVMTAL